MKGKEEAEERAYATNEDGRKRVEAPSLLVTWVVGFLFR